MQLSYKIHFNYCRVFFRVLSLVFIQVVISSIVIQSIDEFESQ